MKENFIFSILTIIISLFFLIISLLNPVRSSTFIGPNAWPNIVLSVTLVLGILQLLKAIRESKNFVADNENHVKTIDNCKKNNLLLEKSHWIILAALALYIFLLPYLGFLIATPILIIFLFWLFGMRKKIKIIISTIISNSAFILLFAHLLNITLPRGSGMFEKLSFIFF